MKLSFNEYATTGACRIDEGSDALKIEFTAGGRLAFDRFSTLKDTVSVEVDHSACGEVFLGLVGIKTDGTTEVFRSDKLVGGTLSYTYDPINLSVYRDMQSFYVEIYAKSDARVELKRFCVTDEVEFAVNTEEAQVSGEKHDLPNKMLFMGNSLLLGMEMSFGMCSSANDKDYFYHVSEYVKTKSPRCIFEKLHASPFEHCESLEAFEEAYYTVPNTYTGKPMCESFTEDLDVIVLQAGDNINTESKNQTFAKSGDLFIERIKKASPRARIIWVHGWYNREPTYSYIVGLCKRWGIERLEIGDTRSYEAEAHDYPNFIGKEGNPTPIKDTWRTHPGDIGMKRIADKLIALLNLK